jgi:hypothetical protein
MNNNRSAEISIFIANLRSGIWLLGIPSWIFGMADRSIASLADGYVSAVELAQLLTAAFLLLSWISLKPESSLEPSNVDLDSYPSLWPFQDRMLDLRQRHMISQEYMPNLPLAQPETSGKCS